MHFVLLGKQSVYWIWKNTCNWWMERVLNVPFDIIETFWRVDGTLERCSELMYPNCWRCPNYHLKIVYWSTFYWMNAFIFSFCIKSISFVDLPRKTHAKYSICLCNNQFNPFPSQYICAFETKLCAGSFYIFSTKNQQNTKSFAYK